MEWAFHSGDDAKPKGSLGSAERKNGFDIKERKSGLDGDEQ